jgi:hypothetical protein
MKNYDDIGCRVHLNPNGSDLRCGDTATYRNWNASEGVVQLCEICRLKKQNKTMLEMLNRRYTNQNGEQ